MNASTDSITPAPTDATIIAKWAAAQDDGNAPHLTLPELRRLIELTRSPRDRADLLDAYVCELEASGTDADVRALDPTATGGDEETCYACAGTGEGLTDYAPCAVCNGRGYLGPDAMGDEDRDLSWLDEYAVQVQADEWAVA